MHLFFNKENGGDTRKTDFLFEFILFIDWVSCPISRNKTEHFCDTPNPIEKHCALRLSCFPCLETHHTLWVLFYDDFFVFTFQLICIHALCCCEFTRIHCLRFRTFDCRVVDRLCGKLFTVVVYSTIILMITEARSYSGHYAPPPPEKTVRHKTKSERSITNVLCWSVSRVSLLYLN